MKNNPLNSIVKNNPYLHDLMNNNILGESIDQIQLENNQSDYSSQETGFSGGLISFHNALKQEIENFSNKGMIFNIFYCMSDTLNRKTILLF